MESAHPVLPLAVAGDVHATDRQHLHPFRLQPLCQVLRAEEPLLLAGDGDEVDGDRRRSRRSALAISSAMETPLASSMAPGASAFGSITSLGMKS